MITHCFSKQQFEKKIEKCRVLVNVDIISIVKILSMCGELTLQEKSVTGSLEGTNAAPRLFAWCGPRLLREGAQIGKDCGKRMDLRLVCVTAHDEEH